MALFCNERKSQFLGQSIVLIDLSDFSYFLSHPFIYYFAQFLILLC